MQQNFKLIPKFDKNLMAIYLVLPNGENRQILQCVFPNDNQMGDNVKVADEAPGEQREPWLGEVTAIGSTDSYQAC